MWIETKVEPRYDEGLKGWQNLFALSRFFVINLTITVVKKIVRYTFVPPPTPSKRSHLSWEGQQSSILIILSVRTLYMYQNSLNGFVSGQLSG